MNYTQILDLLQTVAVLITGGLACYFKFSKKAKTKAQQIQKAMSEILANVVLYIKDAEENYKDVTNAGGQKFEEVVNRLHDLLPNGIDDIITRDMIADIVQRTFDEMEIFIAAQLDEKIDVKE